MSRAMRTRRQRLEWCERRKRIRELTIGDSVQHRVQLRIIQDLLARLRNCGVIFRCGLRSVI